VARGDPLLRLDEARVARVVRQEVRERRRASANRPSPAPRPPPRSARRPPAPPPEARDQVRGGRDRLAYRPAFLSASVVFQKTCSAPGRPK